MHAHHVDLVKRHLSIRGSCVGCESALRTTTGLLIAMLAVGAMDPPTVGAFRGTPIPVEADRCTVSPRPTDELRELFAVGLAPIAAFEAGTPEPFIENGFYPNEYVPSTGEPADIAETAAATEVITQFFACSLAGDIPAMTATVTECGAANLLGIGYLGFSGKLGALFGTPVDQPRGDATEAFLESLPTRTPRGDSGSTAVEIVSLRHLGQDQLEARLVVSTVGAKAGNEPTAPTYPFLTRNGDGYLIDFKPDFSSD